MRLLVLVVKILQFPDYNFVIKFISGIWGMPDCVLDLLMTFSIVKLVVNFYNLLYMYYKFYFSY